MAHREGIRNYLKGVQVYGLVIDWGCGTKPIKNYLKSNEARFIGIDKLDHVGSDVVEDIEWPIFLDGKADFAFCLEVIEHIWSTRDLLLNIASNLKDGGILYLSQPFLYPVHKEDDRIRYTHYGLYQLLNEAGFTVEDLQATVGTLDKAEGYIVKAVK